MTTSTTSPKSGKSGKPGKSGKSGTAWRPILGSALCWLLLWQGLAVAVGQEILLPSPLQVGQTLALLWQSPLFWRQLLASLLRVSLGVSIGTVLGLVLAVVTWRWALTRQFLSPALKMIQATPVVSFILLLLLWLPRDLVPVSVSALMVLPLLWSNTVKGLEQTASQLTQVAQVYGFSPLQRCTLLYGPSILPYFRSALSVGVGLGWKAGVAAEVLCRPLQAIGSEMSQSKIYFDTPSLFAWTVVVIVLSVVMEWLLLRLIPQGQIYQEVEG